MKLFAHLITAGAGLLLAGAAWSANLTEADINRMLTQIDQAAQSHDVEGVIKLLAPQAKMNIDMTALGAPQVMRLSRSEYANELRNSWSQSQSYSYQRSNTKIRIAPGGQSAQVTATIKEVMKMQGQTVTALTDETSRVELIKGQPLVTEVHGIVKSIR